MTTDPSIHELDALSGHKVLVVEDDYFIASEMRRTLSTRGAEVLGPVATVDKALALIAASSEIDVAVLDVNLRDVKVFPVADALKTRGVPFVFVTGYDEATIPARYTHVQRCEKPAGIDTLAQVLSKEINIH
ncbi:MULTISPECIES: response regulator [unclassified Methylobacterium]|jgi:CheY-like chemotaxis protein|uniref:response regulator n=1 Tax=unclassified Methylobacterium TaxID=2615210 RepID=UPI00135333A7|nr:response regulator [Methylobacterium sp. 2A]MWV21263.1 response regulator [Methylobacterium sp. 2A]